jgi:hypothetical protein
LPNLIDGRAPALFQPAESGAPLALELSAAKANIANGNSRIRSSYAGRMEFSKWGPDDARVERDFSEVMRNTLGFPYSDSGFSRIRFTADLASDSRVIESFLLPNKIVVHSLLQAVLAV